MARGQVDWAKRGLTVLIGVPTAIAILRTDVGMLLLATSICLGCLYEFSITICARICPSRAVTIASFPHLALLMTCGVLGCASAFASDVNVYDLTTLGLFILVITYHFATAVHPINQQSLQSLLLDLFALVYIVNGLARAIMLRTISPHGFGLQLLGLCCSWVGDSAALIGGAFLGRSKLTPCISPGKTFMGAVFGLLSSIGTVVGFFQASSWAAGDTPLLSAAVSLPHQCIVGGIIGILCILGDLMESYIKRVADVKDSGRLFPGHGGCLDRMDSFLFVGPFLYYYCHIVGL